VSSLLTWQATEKETRSALFELLSHTTHVQPEGYDPFPKA